MNLATDPTPILGHPVIPANGPGGGGTSQPEPAAPVPPAPIELPAPAPLAAQAPASAISSASPAAALTASTGTPWTPQRRPPPPSLWAEFMSWPGGASMLYLLSAACLLGGAALVLAPGGGDEARIAERFGMIGSVDAYVAALLGVALLVVRWKPGHDDAVALSALLALFAVGAQTPLAVIAAQRPWAALLLGLGGCALGWGIASRFALRIGAAPLGGLLAGALAATQLWHALAPATLGLAYRHLGTAPEVLRAAWLPGWWWLSAALALLVIAADRARPGADDAGKPLVQRAGLRWTLALAAVAAGGLHQYLVAYSFDLGIRPLDLLAIPLALAVAGDLLALRFLALPAMHAAGWQAALLVVTLGAVSSGRFSASGGAEAVFDPTVLMTAMAGAMGLVAWRRRSGWHLALAIAWVHGAVLIFGSLPGQVLYHTGAFGLLLLATLLAAAAWTRRLGLAVAAAAGLALATAWACDHLTGLRGQGIPPFAAFCGLLGLQLMALQLLFRAVFPTALAAAAGLLLGIGLLVCSWGHSPLQGWPWSAALAGAGLALAHGWRLRAWHALPGACTPLLPLVVRALPALIPEQKGWLAIPLAFALLGVGAWLSRRRVAPPDPTSPR